MGTGRCFAGRWKQAPLQGGVNLCYLYCTVGTAVDIERKEEGGGFEIVGGSPLRTLSECLFVFVCRIGMRNKARKDLYVFSVCLSTPVSCTQSCA